MNTRKLYLLLFFILLIGIKVHGQAQGGDPWGSNPSDPGPIPIAGVWYFVMLALGVGAKKLNDVRKKKS